MCSRRLHEPLSHVMPAQQRFQDALRGAGLRLTPQRRAICDYLAQVSGHPTPSAVFEALAAEYPGISRATVYNTLNTLYALGALTQIELGDGHTHYETNLTPHVNLICRRCNRVTDHGGHAPIDPHDLSWVNLSHARQFHAEALHIHVIGLCDDCKQQAHDPSRAQEAGQGDGDAQ